MRAAFGDDGYAVQEGVFGPDEVETLRLAIEDTTAAVTARAERLGAGPEGRLADGHRVQLSSRSTIQWEWTEGSRAIRVLEPCHHLHPAFEELFGDARMLTPVRGELGDAVEPFTSKLNAKRAGEGSEFPYHQDFPYWYVSVGWDAADVVTGIVFLDDAEDANGALRVVPGSHRNGPVRRDPADPTGFLVDPTAVDPADEIVVEVPAGSVIWFGAFLVHRSSPNRSGAHRRALLPSWQPAGRVRMQDVPFAPERVHDLP